MNPTDGISGHWWGSVGWPTAHLLRPGVTPATTLCGRRVPGPLMSGETAALRRCGQCARRTLTDTRPPRDPEAVAALADLIHAAITDAGVDCPDLPDTHADDRGVCWTVAQAVHRARIAPLEAAALPALAILDGTATAGDVGEWEHTAEQLRAALNMEDTDD